MTFGFGAALIASQYYCLIFRITAVMVHSDMQRKVLSPQFTVFFLAVIATAGCSIAYGVYVAAGFEPVSCRIRGRRTRQPFYLRIFISTFTMPLLST